MSICAKLFATVTYGVYKASNCLYDSKVEGLEKIVGLKGVLLASKHSSDLDIFLARVLLPNGSKIVLTNKSFNRVFAGVLRELDYIPVVNPRTREDTKSTSIAAFKEIYNVLHKGDWVVYTPEAGCYPGRIGEVLHTELLERLAQKGYNIALVGVKYANQKHPLLSFLPWNRGVSIVVEPYQAVGKNHELVQKEVRERLATLSGIK